MSTMSPGARRSSTKITIDMPSSVKIATTNRCARYVFTDARLLVGPHVLHAAEVVDVVLRHQPLHVRPVREVVHAPGQDRPRRLLLELLLDGVDHEQALLLVDLLRLLVDHLLDL